MKAAVLLGLVALPACLLALWAWSSLRAQDAPPEERRPVPTTLAEAHAELEEILPAEELARIDAMPSSEDMVFYHRSLGMRIRNQWGLWRGGPLAVQMNALGFSDPDDISGTILATFWCKRHSQDFQLKERAEKYARYWEEARQRDTDEKKRVVEAKAALRSMMMGLHFYGQAAPTVRMPDRTESSLRARFLAPYGTGMFLSVRGLLQGPKDDEFTLKGYFYDPADGRLHLIRVPEIDEVHSVVVVGGTAWFVGVEDGRNVLLGVKGNHRQTPPLPLAGLPQLGLDGQSLLAVYAKEVFRWANGQWEHVGASREPLPRSGPPLELHGNRLFLRDEGRGENAKRLWWLQSDGELTSLDRDVKVVGSEGPRWENSFSHAFTQDGAFWACVGEGGKPQSLLRRAPDGIYAVAIMNNSVSFTPELLGSGETNEGLSVSAVMARPDGTLLLVGDSGLYHLDGKELTREVAFENTRQGIPIQDGKNVYHWGWDPSDVAPFEEGYFVAGAFGGVYLLRKDAAGQWELRSLDEHLGEPVVW